MAKIEKYRKGAEAGDNEFTSFVNYGVRKKPEGRYKFKRIMMICGYILFAFLYIFVCLVLTKAAMLIAILPVLTWILTYFTWLWVNIEYEYTIVGGNFKLAEVYGMRFFRELCTVKVSSMTLIAPYSGKYKDDVDSAAIINRCYGVSSMSSPDVYFGLYTDKKGYECAVFFEATEKTLKVIKYYNSDVVLSKTRY
jgi:hypothetical protein